MLGVGQANASTYQVEGDDGRARTGVSGYQVEGDDGRARTGVSRFGADRDRLGKPLSLRGYGGVSFLQNTYP
jgi:hypothetical protein